MFLKVFEQGVHVEFDDPYVNRLIISCYAAFLLPQRPESVSLKLNVLSCSPEPGWTVDDGDSSVYCNTLADLVYFIEKGMTVPLQRLRKDLYFVHAAAVALDDDCTLLVGESGVGKSTLCWNLCNAGFTYLSDELAPVDPGTLHVTPYPHALCLKTASNAIAALPPSTLDTSVTLHVPVDALPLPVAADPARIRNIVFLTHSNGDGDPVVEEIPRSEAAARLYANSLNQLAHEKDGLSAAATLVSGAACFHLERTSAAEMCNSVRRLVG